MYREFRDRAAFYVVYILEAHPSDLWHDVENEQAGIKVRNARTASEREATAGACVLDLKLEIPALVDRMDNAVERSFTGWPDRIYVVDKDGRVAYKSAAGPYGFRPAEAEDRLRELLVSQ
jgi:hypothetical protein